MDLEKMLSMQKELDERIIKDKGLEGQDLFPNTVLALQVELAEFANEGRWFKHWSSDQKPRHKKTEWKIIKNSPIRNEFISNLDAEANYAFVELVEQKPLIEEFVDGVHFFLSIAIQKGWQEALWVYVEQLDPDDFDGELTSWYLEMTYFLSLAYARKYSDEENTKCLKALGYPRNQYDFRTAWIMFLNIGINGFGFTPEQIEQAYMDKNAVNHQRQQEGY
jgi:dimeric dUTPase (all-alpha-NTP-PPase superfamily)